MTEHKLTAVSQIRVRLRALVPQNLVEIRSPRFSGEAEPFPEIPSTVLLECAIRTDFRHGLGALLGLAVGDALGTTLEFTSIDGLSFPQLARGPHREITGGGPFRLQPGQVTDDTQMAVGLFDSIVENTGLNAADVLARYRSWMAIAFDVGNQTRAALGAHGDGRAVWESSGRRAAGNGALMRTAPIGVLFATDPTARRDATFGDGALTHFDPRSQLACAAFNAAIGAAVELRDHAVTTDRLVGVLRDEVGAAGDALAARHPDISGEIGEARASTIEDIELASRDDPQLYGPAIDLRKQQGFVRVGFRLALWELLHAPSFEDGVIDVVNRGGDADTNGAIAGALLGAYYGIDAIPDRWLATLLGVEVVGLMHLHPSRFVDGLSELHGRGSDLDSQRRARPR
jgi:ADP-ribosylglycohydrolase